MKISTLAAAALAGLSLNFHAPAAAAHPLYDEEEVHYFSGIDCKRDSGPAVDTICSHDKLLYLDQKIAQRYSEAYDRAGALDKIRLKREQRRFLEIRDGCGKDKGCLDDILHHRVQTIGRS